MKMRLFGALSLALAGAANIGGCSDDAAVFDADDAALPDSGPEASPRFDAGLDATPLTDSSVSCGAGQFCPTSLPGTPAPGLNAIFATSSTRAVAGTKDGKILLWNGTTWTTIAQGYGSLTAVWGIDADHYLIAQDQSWALIRLTISGADATVAEEDIPFDSACAPTAISISGQSATDIYIAAYCRSIDYNTFTVGYTGLVFHAAAPSADAGASAVRSWSKVWSAGGPSLPATALGGVYQLSPGHALVGGWQSPAESNPSPTTLKAAVTGDPTAPLTTTFVLDVKGSVVTRHDLPIALAMCVQSIWSSPAEDSVFIGGVCSDVYPPNPADTTTKYTTIAHQVPLADGGAGAFTGVVRAAYGTIFDQPGRLVGFGTADVFAAGSYLTRWDGTTFQLVSTATAGGSPLASRVNGLQGISSSDLWMVGEGYALHRTP